MLRDGLIASIVVGGIAGWLASLITGTNEKMGCLLNIVVGILGGFIGAWLFSKLGIQRPGGEWIGPILIAFVGATVFLALLRLVLGRR